MVLDSRDQRVISPHQGWFALEIADNAQSNVNVITDARQVLRPQSGYYFNWFSVHTLQYWKFTLSMNMETARAYPCGRWNDISALALQQDEFQPLFWPAQMSDTAPVVCDVKIKAAGSLIMHFRFKGLRSPTDCTVVQPEIFEEVISSMADLPGGLDGMEIQVVVTVFSKFDVVCVSFEPGQRTYNLAREGAVICGDHPRCPSRSGGWLATVLTLSAPTLIRWSSSSTTPAIVSRQELIACQFRPPG